MDREVLARRDVRALAERVDLTELTIAELPAELAAVARGCGTFALAADGALLARLPAGASAADWLAFVAVARRAAPELDALRRRARLTPADWLRRARLELELGLPDAAAASLLRAPADAELAVRVHEARGDVRAMRAALAGCGDPAPRALAARVLLAERRPADALALLDAVPAADRSGDERLLHARALADHGEPRSAAAELTALLDGPASADAALVGAARRLLATLLFDRGHAHAAGEGR